MDFHVTKYQPLITSLILNGHFINNIGLMHGKMGLAIQFYHLARKTGNAAFGVFAGELMDDIIPHLSVEMPVDFENGLAGIAWGIEYLVQHSFLEVEDGDEVLPEFDKHIFRSFLENVSPNLDLLNGVLGTGHYFLMRVRGVAKQQEDVITKTNKIALQHICSQLSMMLPQIIYCLGEPRRSNSAEEKTAKKSGTEALPIFDITWNLPALIGFLAQMFEPDVYPPEDLLINILTSLDSANLPVLQCNKLLLLLSLVILKNKTQHSSARAKHEITQLTEKINEKLLTGLDHEKYTVELSGLDFSIRNGISGMALIHSILYEQTKDPNHNKEYSSLLEKFITDKTLNGFRYDYTDPAKANEHDLGILQGISGLLLTSVYN